MSKTSDSGQPTGDGAGGRGWGELAAIVGQKSAPKASIHF